MKTITSVAFVNLVPFALRLLDAVTATTTTTLWPKVGPWLLPVLLCHTHTRNTLTAFSLLLACVVTLIAAARASPSGKYGSHRAFTTSFGGPQGAYTWPLKIHCSRSWLERNLIQICSSPPDPIPTSRKVEMYHHKRSLTSKSKEARKHETPRDS